MSRIVCGMFDRTVDADAAIAQLKREGLQPTEVDSFYVGPPGQNNLTPIGGDAHSDAGAQGAGAGAFRGALIGLFPGVAIGLLASIKLGVESIPLLTLLGALIGAFAGAMLKLHAPRRSLATREHPAEPRGGRMVAACVDGGGAEPRALEALRSNGARDVRRAEGEWRNGWRDFDPRSPLAPA
jgi:hypothetical protein